MSHHATTRAWDSNATGIELLVLLALADFAGGHDDPYDYAYPAVATLAAKTGLAPRTVQRSLRVLVETGAIRRTGQHEWTPRKTTIQYRIETLSEGCHADTPTAQGVSETTPEGCHADTQPRPLTPSKEEGARASTPDEPPDGFPDELRPHANAVLALLREAAVERGAKAVTVRAVGRVIMDHPRKPLVAAAQSMRAWLLDGNGTSAPCKDVVARYRKWVEREQDLAAPERLDAAGHPAASAHRDAVQRRGGGESPRDRQLRERQARADQNLRAMTALHREMGIGDENRAAKDKRELEQTTDTREGR